MSKTMNSNIENYGNQIETIEDFPAAVRKVPGMYIGRTGNDGFLTMIREVYQNSIDEMMKHNSPCTEVTLVYNEDTKVVSVSDNGRGIPFDKIEKVFTSPHTSSNYTKQKGEYSSGLHGVGAKVTNALSEWFVVYSYLNIPGNCTARCAEFDNGYLNSKGVYEIDNPGIQGTRIDFKVSEELMGKINVPGERVYNLAMGILYLTDINSVVNYEHIVNGRSVKKRLVNTLGIQSILETFIKTPITAESIRCFNDTGYMKADIAFTFDMEAPQTTVLGYSNFCPTKSGTHINGFMDGVIKYFKDYMNKIYLKDINNKRKKNKLTVNTVDIRDNLVGIVSVSHLEPIFTGQAKDELSNEDMYVYVRDLVIVCLQQWEVNNKSDMLKICKYLKDMAEIRLKNDTDKIKLTDKFKSSTLSKGLPSKFVPPNGNKDLELIICEGDSASGSFKNSRDHNKQGLFPIRGKIKNAIGRAKKDSLSNSEVAGILTIIGAGAGTKHFNVNQVKWDKIIFATDADVDGGHISSLLLNMLLVHCPELVAAGKVYKAVPPLYGIDKGKKTTYLKDDKAYIDYVQKLFLKSNELLDCESKPMSKARTTNLLYANMDLVYWVNKVSMAYSVSPDLLELMCILTVENNVKIQPESLPHVQSRISSIDRFRFVKASIVDGRLMMTGLVDGKTNRLHMNDRLLLASEYILRALNNEEYWFMLNGELVSLYQLMYRFEHFKPKNIARYKGLGEMNPPQLAESTLHPDGDRTLIRYTMDSAMAEINSIVELEKNKKRLIEGVEVSMQDLV